MKPFLLEFFGSFSTEPGLHTLRYSELGVQFSLGRTNNLSKMRQAWLKQYASSGRPKVVTNLGLKAFINRLIQSYKDDPFWEDPQSPVLEWETEGSVNRLYPFMPTNNAGALAAKRKRKRVLPVKYEPAEVSSLPIAVPIAAVALPIPVTAIKREGAEEERASKRLRLEPSARRGASPSSSTPLPSTGGKSGLSRKRKEGGSSSLTTTKGPSTTTTRGPEETNVGQLDELAANTPEVPVANNSEVSDADKIPESTGPFTKLDESTIHTPEPREPNEGDLGKPDESAANTPEILGVDNMPESTDPGTKLDETSLEIVKARSREDKGGLDIKSMLDAAIVYLGTRGVSARPLTKVEVNRVGSCLPDSLVAITDPDVDQGTLAEKSGSLRHDSVDRFVGAVQTATGEQLEKLLNLAVPKAGEVAPKSKEELIALVSSYKEADKYAGEGGDIFALLCAYHLASPLLVVDLFDDRAPNTRVIYPDLIFTDRVGASNLPPILVVRKKEHFEPLLIGVDQTADLWGLVNAHRKMDFPSDLEKAAEQRRIEENERIESEDEERMRLAVAKSLETAGDLDHKQDPKYYPYSCDQCGEGFSSEPKLRSHVGVHEVSGNGEKAIAGTARNKGDEGEEVGLGLARGVAGDDDVQDLLPDPTVPAVVTPGEVQGVAEAPGLVEVTLHEDEGHQILQSKHFKASVINGNLVCDSCGFVSQSKRQVEMMRSHHKSVHTAVGALSCDQCGVIVTNGKTLKRHMSYLHDG